MGYRDSWTKQVRNNRVVCILVAASAVSFLVYCSSQLSNGEETAENPRLWINFSFRQSSQAVESLASSASSLQNITVTVNHGDKNSISPEIWDGISPTARLDGYEVNSHSVNQSYSGENLASDKGPLKRYPDQVEEKESNSVYQSQNISAFGAVVDRRTDGKVYTVREKENPPIHSVNQSYSGENLASEKGPLKRYPDQVEEKESNSVYQSQNISAFGAVVDRRTDGKVYTVREKENPPIQCDIYSGKWVRDDSYPLYPAGECSYMSGAFDCKRNGRPDSGYTQWRWQPRDCNLPRLNATNMLEKLRGKRLMFIGDSINRNQWESLLCILNTVIPENRKTLGSKGVRTIFLAKDYNCTVELFWAPFLVEQGSVNVGNKSKEILQLDAIEKHGTDWKDVDILVFNSGHWWTHGNKAATRDFFKEGDYLHPELDPLVAFEKGLTTWAKWIDHNIDPAKTRVFFRGFSPMHFSSEQWHNSGTHKCNFETQPIFKESMVMKPSPVMLRLVDKVLRHMKFPVSFLNITKLSDFRKDAHPSVYTLRRNKKLTQEQRNNPDDWGDCSHWCLPGLPDIWNELLYGSLVIEPSTTPSP